MDSKRVKTIILHSWYHLNHAMETWIDLFWFSTIQIIVFGLISIYLIGSGNTEQANHLLMGLVLWEVLLVGQYSVALGALWEIWSKSFSTMFITPLTLAEYLTGEMISGLIKAVAVFALTAILAYFLYGFSIFLLGFALIIFFVEIITFAWSAGMFIVGLIFRFGTNIQSLSWGLIFILQPLAAVFYPISVLPTYIRWISYIFPVTYIFEAARERLSTGNVNWNYLMIATVLNIVYFAASYLFVKKMLANAKKTGAFARMEG